MRVGKMSEKRFKTKYYLKGMQGVVLGVVKVNEEENVLHWNEVVDLLNEQQATIIKLQDLCGESDGENAKLRIENKKLKAKLKEKEEDEQLYANEIVKLNKEAKEVLDFKSLGGDY